MAMEWRIITFTQREVLTAVRGFVGLPEVTAGHDDKSVLVLYEDQGICAKLGSHGAVKAQTLSQSELAAAIIRYCVRKHLPLPRQAERSLKLDRGVLSLVVHIKHPDGAEAEPSGAAEQAEADDGAATAATSASAA